MSKVSCVKFNTSFTESFMAISAVVIILTLQTCWMTCLDLSVEVEANELINAIINFAQICHAQIFCFVFILDEKITLMPSRLEMK